MFLSNAVSVFLFLLVWSDSQPSSNAAQLKGSQQQGALVHFSLFREKRKKHKIWQFSNYVDFSCINEQDMFENSEFMRFCNDSTALSEKILILAISFLQQGT